MKKSLVTHDVSAWASTVDAKEDNWEVTTIDIPNAYIQGPPWKRCCVGERNWRLKDSVNFWDCSKSRQKWSFTSREPLAQEQFCCTSITSQFINWTNPCPGMKNKVFQWSQWCFAVLSMSQNAPQNVKHTLRILNIDAWEKHPLLFSHCATGTNTHHIAWQIIHLWHLLVTKHSCGVDSAKFCVSLNTFHKNTCFPPISTHSLQWMPFSMFLHSNLWDSDCANMTKPSIADCADQLRIELHVGCF